MREIDRIIVSGILISKDNKMLLGMGRPGSVYKDCWLIPGGGSDDGETKTQTLKREIEEETNLDILDFPIELVDDSAEGRSEKTLKETGETVMVNMSFFTYRITIPKLAKDINAKPGDDLVEIEWVSINNLADYKLSPPSAKLFKTLGYLN